MHKLSVPSRTWAIMFGLGLTLSTVGALANDQLAQMAKHPSQWVMPSGDYTGQRHSALDQVTELARHRLAQLSLQGRRRPAGYHRCAGVYRGRSEKRHAGRVSWFEQYNSYCFRCHGGDAAGGEYAPDLRKSLAGGMTWDQFLSTAMVGRQAKGMPAWVGFFEEKDIRAIYVYVKARQLDLIPMGRPPSG